MDNSIGRSSDRIEKMTQYLKALEEQHLQRKAEYEEERRRSRQEYKRKLEEIEQKAEEAAEQIELRYRLKKVAMISAYSREKVDKILPAEHHSSTYKSLANISCSPSLPLDEIDANRCGYEFLHPGDTNKSIGSLVADETLQFPPEADCRKLRNKEKSTVHQPVDTDCEAQCRTFHQNRSPLNVKDGVDNNVYTNGTDFKMRCNTEQIGNMLQLVHTAKQMNLISNTGYFQTQFNHNYVCLIGIASFTFVCNRQRWRKIVSFFWSYCCSCDRLRGVVCMGFDPGGVINTTMRKLMHYGSSFQFQPKGVR